MGGGIWDYDIQADSLYCNDRWYEIMGLSPESDPVTRIGDLTRHVYEPDVTAAIGIDFDHVAELLARDERYNVEFRIVRPDGELRWLRSVACIIRDADDHLRAVGCVTDITEFRALGVEPHHWTGADATAVAAADVPATGGASAAPDGQQDKVADPLSERERECLLWVSMGKTAWETASILGRSQRTVEFHLKNATRKLNAANKIHAAALAIRLGLL